ncbi:MAG: class I SAM-dependent methyltransferase [Patescibacteria group bacterium]
MSVLFEVWRRTVPETAVDRYRDIRRNLEALGKDGLIPSTVSRAADVGYGSGGGTVALADLFPKAIVTAIDNASSQQLHMQYLRRDLPRWSGRIEAIEEDARIAAQKHGAHDLVLASRPNMVDPGKSTTWEEDSVFIARNFVALAEMAEPQSGKY